MSESLRFCQKIASTPERSSYSDRDWDKAIEIQGTEHMFDKFLQGERKLSVEGTDYKGRAISFSIEISFNKNAAFDYFSSDSSIHDGTLLFIQELIDNCIGKVCTGNSYYKPLGETCNGDTVKYTIGNFVVLDEYDGDFIPEDKPWLRQRTTVLLPLKMEKLSFCKE